MALASRSARRSGAGRRWLLIAIVITLLVLLIDAALRARSPGPGQQLAAGAWVDRVLPIVSASTAEGNQISAIWTNGIHTPPAALTSQLNQIAADSAHNYQQLVALRPPANLAGAAGLLEASLLTRSQAASTLRSALLPVLQGGGSSGTSTTATTATTTTATTATAATATATTTATSATVSSTPPTTTVGPDPVVTAIQAAGDDMQIGDRAYQLFLHDLPKLGVTIPASAWASNPAPYQTDAAQLFLTTLRNNLSASPVHQLEIYSILLTPAPVALQGKTQVLPNSSTLGVTVVVADTGNQPEKDLTVTAAISAAGSSSSVRDFVDLVAGQARTITQMGPLNPPQGLPVALTVTVTPLAGSGASIVSKTMTFLMPGSSSSATTTVPGRASSTTASPSG
jgi:hypothetical protein